MVAKMFTETRPWPKAGALTLAAILLVAELGLIGVIYKHLITFKCLANWPAWACSGASGVLIAVYAILATLALYFILRPAALTSLLAEAGHSARPLAVNLVGFAITLVPVALLQPGAGPETLPAAFAFWTLGFGLLCTGLLLFIAPLHRWRALWSTDAGPMIAVILAGVSAPYLATLIRPLWRIDVITDATFQAVVWSIEALGYAVETDPVKKVVGFDTFYIDIAPVCSGIEGIALVTIFVTL